MTKNTQGAAEVAPEDTQGETISLALAEIALDRSLQVRAGLCDQTVRRYAQAYKNGAAMPPLVVARCEQGYVLVSGWHRREALCSIGQHRAECRVIEADPKELPWIAARANLKHGLRLKTRELRGVFQVYIRAGQHRPTTGGLKSYREIAAELGDISHNTARNWMMKDFPKVARKMAGVDDGCWGAGGCNHLGGEAALAEQARDHIAQAMAALRALRDPRHKLDVGQALYELVGEAKAAGVFQPSDY